MSSVFDQLRKEGLILDAPSHMRNNIHYEVQMGSVAYGVSNDYSDVDIYGFSMPPKNILFPYHMGYMYGFGKKPDNFEQYQKHHIKAPNGTEYDISIYNIVKFFQLCMENNPNMVDALFVPQRCVLHCTAIGNYVRDQRKLFLSKRSWHKFKGYAFSQLHKMRSKHALEFVEICDMYGLDIYAPLEELLENMPYKSEHRKRIVSLVKEIEKNGARSKRLHIIQKYGYDTKFGYHVVRLIDECEQILETGDVDLTRAREQMKAIRNGEWSMERVIEYFESKNAQLEELYAKTTEVPHSPPEEDIKNILLECIEMHYGSIDKFVRTDDRLAQYLLDAQRSIDNALKQV